MSRWILRLAACFVTGFAVGSNVCVAAPPEAVSKSLIFHAPFDGGTDARIGVDRSLYTSDSLERKSEVAGNHRTDVSIVSGAGRFGDALRFKDNSPQVIFYKGANAGFKEKDWSGTVSFWLKVDPDKDLKPGYCDPIQITDKTWNDAAFFVDFDKELPRTFRLGVFSNYKFWNPKNTAWEQVAETDRPMVPVVKPPFRSDEWTHVVYAFENINASDNAASTATLYLNGKKQGTLKHPLQFSWDPSKAAIMLGISYIGDFDDLAIFDRALTPEEIATVYQLPDGLK
ncbi:MAG: LamG domain-containing protein [Planctomycetota bacterium]|jgi:hypothetical protein|nr:MAG: LamG domain-containing protein [Planctomycetota bacterium]